MSTIDASFHYGKAMNSEELFPWSIDASKAILREAEERDLIPLLVYCGMSGVAAATAIAMVLQSKEENFAQVYIRKENEKSHGTAAQLSRNIEVEGLANYDKIVRFDSDDMFPIFVDDIISSGETFRYTMEGLANIMTPNFTYKKDDWALVLQNTWSKERCGAKVIHGYMGGF